MSRSAIAAAKTRNPTKRTRQLNSDFTSAEGYAHTELRRPRWHVEHDRGRALVEKTLDEFHERVWILKGGIRIEARDNEEFPVALDAPVDPPRPHFLALTPAPDLHSGHASPSLHALGLGQGSACSER
jgi:hypothetical protein